MKVERYTPESARKWATRRKLRLTPESPMLRIPRADCGVGQNEPMAYVRRRGCSAYLLRYPVFDMDPDGAFLFLFDKLMFGLPAGRYAVEVWQGDKPNPSDCSVGQICGEFEVMLSGPCTINVNMIEAVESNRPLIRKGDYPVTHPIFDAVKDFTAQLCDASEAGRPTLPLKAVDKSTLCAMVLCQPVELRICDGVRVETVRFTGCVAGEPQFVRNVDGEGGYKFPRGATLTFDWTENNITAACEGC